MNLPTRRALLVLAFVGVLAGCRVDADVEVVFREDGSGTIAATITLDAEAVQRIEANGRTLEDAVPLADLEAAGWTVTPWKRADSGAATVRVDHEFADAQELMARRLELDGGAILRDSSIDRERGLFQSRDEVTLDVDLSAVGTQILEDDELVASLQAAGVDVAALDEQLAGELRESLRVNVTVEAPGNRVTTAQLAPGESREVAAAQSEFDSNRLILVLIGVMLFFLAVLLYLAASASARRGRRYQRQVARDAEADSIPLM